MLTSIITFNTLRKLFLFYLLVLGRECRAVILSTAGNVTLYETPRAYSWSDTNDFCIRQGLLPANYNQICPRGVNENPTTPPLGNLPGTEWVYFRNDSINGYYGYGGFVQIGIDDQGQDQRICHSISSINPSPSINK